MRLRRAFRPILQQCLQAFDGLRRFLGPQVDRKQQIAREFEFRLRFQRFSQELSRLVPFCCAAAIFPTQKSALVCASGPGKIGDARLRGGNVAFGQVQIDQFKNDGEIFGACLLAVSRW